MVNAVNWFEIPATNLARAKRFYETIFAIEMQELDLANNLKMALFPVDKGSIGGAVCEHKDFYHPGLTGPLVYLNGNPDLDAVLARIGPAGGTILMPKTQISPDVGYMALFQDSEGNRVALHSQS